jgi:DNA-binding response OmpR family regulator
MRDYPLAGTRILVVEDEAIIAFDLTEVLTRAGADVVGPARTLAAALGQAARGEFSAALLDVWLGSETVFPVAKALFDRGIPLVFHTGDANGAALTNVWPGCEILTKPASREAIVGIFVKLLARQCGAGAVLS